MPGVVSASVHGVFVADCEADIALEVRGETTVDDVKDWCATRLSAYKQPTVVTVL
jgi:hypothetical protein